MRIKGWMDRPETITGTCKQAVEIEAGLKAKGKQPGVGLVPFFYWR